MAIRSAFLVPSLVLVVLTGCGGKNFEFGEVEGKVTLNNQPLAGALVRFYPISETREQLPIATGLTDAAGNYTLTHQGDKPGAVAGLNRVVVSWPARDMRAVLSRDDKPLPPPSVVIPLHFTMARETPITVEVKAGGPQTIDLPLLD